jgi:2-polyprenyl-3-methyl-5-hydroxy-6-metoxy-1,4-benzoquinol methylase
MDHSSHRDLAAPVDQVQAANRAWWTANPMTYDWAATNGASPRSEAWFDEADRRFVAASFPYLSEHRPFDRIMPESLDGRRVLEIGCGLGLHTEALLARGAEVTAVDLTEAAVRATKTRLTQKGLVARVQEADAEELPFDTGEFDLVWSWGVIHHSAHTTRIVREIARVLAPDGAARVMVYNRDSLIARLILARYYLLGGEFRHRDPDEVLWSHTDGYLARYYHREQFEDLFRGFFATAGAVVLGQETDVVPLPRGLRRRPLDRLGDDRKRAAAGRRGAFLFLTAEHPLRPRGGAA